MGDPQCAWFRRHHRRPGCVLSRGAHPHAGFPPHAHAIRSHRLCFRRVDDAWRLSVQYGERRCSECRGHAKHGGPSEYGRQRRHCDHDHFGDELWPHNSQADHRRLQRPFNSSRAIGLPNMPTLARILDALGMLDHPADDTTKLLSVEERLPPLLSVIAGMVDLIGFFTLGSFTAHVTGNLVVAAAAAVHGGPWNPAQALAIPVFMLAVAAAWLIARASGLHGVALTRLLLVIQFLLLLAVLAFSVSTAPSA